MSTPTTAEELREAQAQEYGQYRAIVPIFIGNALAFAPGHAVPASHVEQGLVSLDQVEKTKPTPKAVATEKKD